MRFSAPSSSSEAKFDYLDWWKYAVKVLNIQPSEAWNLDYVELVTLAEMKQGASQDTSYTVNRQRMMNGCKKSQLKNLK